MPEEVRSVEVGSQMTNTYTHRFVANCPNNDMPILYTLCITTDGREIPVEKIVAATKAIGTAYHEAIAYRLIAQFGGLQTLRAHHHGVDIETVRP
jgi:hypothetical protein